MHTGLLGSLRFLDVPTRPLVRRSLRSTSLASSSELSDESVLRLSDWIAEGRGKSVVLSGAGLSTDSGIPDYRGPNGIYVRNANYKPIMYQDFVTRHPSRQRYWARSYYGYPRVLSARPNASHTALTSLHRSGHLLRGEVSVSSSTEPTTTKTVAARPFLTQNVDSLHQASGAPAEAVLELHGHLRTVSCVLCGHSQTREKWQQALRELNPSWPPAEPLPTDSSRLLDGAQEAIMGAERMSAGFSGGYGAGRGVKSEVDGKDVFGGIPVRPPQQNPDGDADLAVDFGTWRYPDCEKCGGVVKPDVVFFGENILPPNRDLSLALARQASRLLVLGSSLTVFSAFRIVRAALEAKRPVAILNIGPTRADGMPGVWKIEAGVSDVLGDVVRTLDVQR